MYTASSLSIHIDECWSCFHILAIINNAAMNIAYMYLLELVVFLDFLYIYPGVVLLGHMVVVFLVFWGNSVLFFTVVAPIYIPINCVWGLPLRIMKTFDIEKQTFLFSCLAAILNSFRENYLSPACMILLRLYQHMSISGSLVLSIQKHKGGDLPPLSFSVGNLSPQFCTF